MEEFRIRGATLNDLGRVAEIEARCFPAAEAAPKEAFKERIKAFTKSFFLAEIDEKVIGFINGCGTNSPVIYDELYHSISHHIPEGKNLAVFGLDVIPEYRNRGIAAALMNYLIQEARKDGRIGIILTCKLGLVHYYESFGYVNNGISKSNHGSAEWYDMTLSL